MPTPKPKPGTDVHLVLVERGAYRHAKPTWVMEGTVVDNFWWERRLDVFCLLVLNEDVPERVVRMRDVVSINGVMVEGWDGPSTKALTWRVESNSFNGLTYTVSFDGDWRCTCKGFAFHRSCTHIRQKQDQLKGEPA
jgi:hypothetical protein